MPGSSIFSAFGVVGKIVNAIFIESYLAPKCKFSVNDIPDLTGKVVIVTGGNTGIGKETAKVLYAISFVLWSKGAIHPTLTFHVQALLNKNAKVYIAARNEERAKAAIEDLKQVTDREAIWLKLDLASLQSIKDAAEEFLECVQRNDSGQARLIHDW